MAVQQGAREGSTTNDAAISWRRLGQFTPRTAEALSHVTYLGVTGKWRQAGCEMGREPNLPSASPVAREQQGLRSHANLRGLGTCWAVTPLPLASIIVPPASGNQMV